MVEGKYAAIGILLGALGGYYLAYREVVNATCKDANFTTNIGNLHAQCPNLSWYNTMKYYTGQGYF